MIELRQLSYFVAACHQTSFSKAAEVLDIALSTLSVALQNLEEEVGAQLFRRVPAGLTPTVAGRWLYRAAIPLLQAEAFTRQAAMRDCNGQCEFSHLVVEVQLMFSLGNVSKAISSALVGLQREYPDVFIEPHWGSADGEPPLPLTESAESSRIIFSYENKGIAIHDDPWVLARSLPVQIGVMPALQDMLAGPVIVPALPAPLLHDLSAYLQKYPIKNLRFTQDHPGTLARLSGEHPDTAFLVPQSTLANRMGLHRLKLVPLDPPLISQVRMHIADPHPVAEETVRRIRAALASGEPSALYQPQLTRRQFSYFQLIDNNRNLTAAARVAKVAQPAITGQLRKMEQVIGKQLFERRRDGLVPTEAGRIFRIGSDLIEARLQSMAVHSAGSLGRNRSRLRIGVLPSVSQESTLLSGMTDAVLRWRKSHPQIDLQILEAPTSVLQDWVQAGVISLAVLETDMPHMARFSLNVEEPLSLICHPDMAAELSQNTGVDLETLRQVPLVLPTMTFGIRQLLEAQLSEHNLSLESVIEINSLPMMIAMIRREKLATLLPVSAVRRDLEQGTLVGLELKPHILRRLFVIYSNARTLTVAERELVRELREALTP